MGCRGWVKFQHNVYLDSFHLYTTCNKFRKNQSIQCVITENEDIKIYPINPIAKAYIMMNEIQNKVSEESGEKIQIEYFVRHKNSY